MMFIAIFSGIAIIWERDVGILQKFLALPVPRVALVLGKAFAAGVRALTQAVIVLGLAAVIGVPLRWYLPDLLGAAVVAVLGAMFFANLSMIIAALAAGRECGQPLELHGRFLARRPGDGTDGPRAR